MENKITKQLYNPNTFANPSDNYLGEVRNGGWLIDRYKGSKDEVQAWLDNHNGTEVQSSVSNEYVHMIKRWANK